MTEVSDNTTDNRTVGSTNSNVTWADKAAAKPQARAKSGGRSLSSLAATLIAAPAKELALLITQASASSPAILSSLQKAKSNTRAAAAAIVSNQQPTASTSSSAVPVHPKQLKAAPAPAPIAQTTFVAPPDPITTKFENMRMGYEAQRIASEKRHSTESALMLKTIAAIQTQLSELQQQNSELVARSMSATSSSSITTSTDLQPYSTPTRRSGTKSRSMQQRSPPVHSSATADSIKRTRNSTSPASSNQYAVLAAIDDEETYIFDEHIDEHICSTSADMSFDDTVENTVTQVAGLSLRPGPPEPASGSNGAGIHQ